MEKVLLISCGELTLKGLNRRRFEIQLVRNIRNALKDMPDFKVEYSQSRMFIKTGNSDFDFEKAMEEIILVPGIVSVALAYKVVSDIDEIIDIPWN